MASSQENKISPEDNIAVGWSVSVTGDSISDDLCQLAAYVPNNSFNQYVMPAAIPNTYIEKNYGLKVNTFKRCRILRHMATNSPLATKTELVTIKEFLKWLQVLKANTSKDLIFVYHDIEDRIQLKLMEVMKRNNLYDEFKNLVKGFCNICFISNVDASSQIKLFSLQELAKVLLDVDDNMHSAFERAKITHDVLQHIVANKNIINRRQIPEDLLEINQDIRQICKDILKRLKARNKNSEFKLSKLLGVYSSSFAEQEKELIEAQNIVDIEKEYDPIFRDYILYSDSTKAQAIRFRNKLISFSITYKHIKSIYEINGRYGLENYFELLQMPKQEHNEMVEIFDCHFDPNKEELIDKIKKSHKARAVAYKRKLIRTSKCTSSKVRPVKRNENGEWEVIPTNSNEEEIVTCNDDSNWIVNEEIVPGFVENVKISPSKDFIHFKNNYSLILQNNPQRSSNVLRPYSNAPVSMNYENQLPSSSQYVHNEFQFNFNPNLSLFNIQNAQAPVIYDRNPYYINPYVQPGSVFNFELTTTTPGNLSKPLNANAPEFIMNTNAENQSVETIVSKSETGKNTILKVSKITKYGTSFTKSSRDGNTTFTVYPTSTTANTIFTNKSIKFELIGNVKNVKRLENTCAASSQDIPPKLENVKKDHESKCEEIKKSTQQTSVINTAPLNLNENWSAAKVWPVSSNVTFKIESTVPDPSKTYKTGYSGVGQGYENEYRSLFLDNVDTQPSTSGLNLNKNISKTWPPPNNDNQAKPIDEASSKVTEKYNPDNLKSTFPYTLNAEHILGSLIQNRNLTPRGEDLNLNDIEMEENQDESISKTKKSDP